MGKGSVGRVGLRGAPAEHERVGAPIEESPSSGGLKPVSSRAHDAVQRPVQYTLRLSYDESDELDGVARALRTRLGRAVTSAEVLRGLVAEAQADPELIERLAQRLTSS